MARRSGLTLAELLLGVLALGTAFWLLAYALTHVPRAREAATTPRCKMHLRQLYRGMEIYLKNLGNDRFYPWPAGRPGCGAVANPRFGGAEWLATLYWARIIPDPGTFICPSSYDSTVEGLNLGSNGTPDGKPLPEAAVSYAAMGDLSVGIYLCSKQGKGAAYATSKLAIRDDFPPNEPMACDDTDEPINHGERDNGGMSVLFFDSHVEYWTHTRVDLEHGVGQGDLCALRN